jgi:hypothetical protein
MKVSILKLFLLGLVVLMSKYFKFIKNLIFNFIISLLTDFVDVKSDVSWIVLQKGVIAEGKSIEKTLFCKTFYSSRNLNFD